MEYWGAYNYYSLYGVPPPPYAYTSATALKVGETASDSCSATCCTNIKQSPRKKGTCESSHDVTVLDDEGDCESSHDVTVLDDEGSCESSHDITVLDDKADDLTDYTKQDYKYLLKAVNPSRVSDYKTIKLHECPRGGFTSLEELRKFIGRNLPSDVEDVPELELGYIEPGHGSKGKKIWVCSDMDLKEMYQLHKGKRQVNLWCYTQKKAKTSTGKKRPRSSSADSDEKKGGSKYQAHSSKKMASVDGIYEKLQEKHKGKYSPEQLRAWSHLLEMGKHGSYNEPPDKPFFRGRKPSTIASSPGTPVKIPVPVGISPCKKVNMRSELIDQLRKWYKLLETGAISDEQYTELKETILGDIKEL